MGKPTKGVDFVRKAKPSEVKAAKKVATKEAQVEVDASAVLPVESFPELVDVLPELAKRSRELTERIAEMEEEKKELNAEIRALLEAVGHNSIVGDTWAAVRVKGSTSSLKPELLLKHGVGMDVIKESTVTSTYWYAQVRGIKE